MENTFYRPKQSQYSHQVMTLALKNILDSIFNNDCDMEGSHERSGAFLFC